MLRKLIAAALLCFASTVAAVPSYAQAPATVRMCFGTGTPCPPVASGNPLPVTGSFSSTGFPTIQTTGTPISVTTGGVTGSLPSGAVVVASNVGTTNAAYCKLGASATTSDQYIAPSGGWFAFTVGANTQLTCITSTSTTTVNMVGGSGLPTGTGGGSGGGGGLSVTDQAVWTQGTSAFTPSGGIFNDAATLSSGQQGTFRMTTKRAQIVDVDATGNQLYSTLTAPPNLLVNGANGVWSALTPGTPQTGTIVAANMDMTSLGGVAFGAMANYGTSPGAVKVQGVNAFVTNTVTTTNGAADPCQSNAATIKSFSITTATTTNIVTGTSAKKLYVCYLYMQTAAANNVAVISGTTGATCGANTAALVGGTTAANGLNNAANSGQAMGNGASSVLQVQTNNDDICIITSASTPLAGVIKTVVQ